MIATRGLPSRSWPSEFAPAPTGATQPSAPLAPSPARAAAPLSAPRRVVLSVVERGRDFFIVPSLAQPGSGDCMHFAAALAFRVHFVERAAGYVTLPGMATMQDV